MNHLKLIPLLLLLFAGITVSGQTKKTKHKSSRSKKTVVTAKEPAGKTAVAAGDSVVAPAMPLPPPPPPPTAMQYFVSSYPEFTVLVKAINATELNSTFETSGPVTVFAPVNRTFDNLPAGVIKDILQPQMRDSLKGVLTYMVIAGSWSLADLQQKIKEGGGTYSIPTIGGSGSLNFLLDGAAVRVKDSRGNQMQLSAPVVTRNGLVYIVDRLLLP